jgi:hypothetical protein
MEWVGAAEFGLPARVIGAAHVFALGLADGDAFAGGEWDGHKALWLTYTNGDWIDRRLHFGSLNALRLRGAPPRHLFGV